jgi:hypothetical protein
VVIAGSVVAVWLFRGWQWIGMISAVRMVLVRLCGCGCGGGKVVLTADVAVAVAGWQWTRGVRRPGFGYLFYI